MSKKQSIIIVTIFCVFIFGVGILTLLQPYEDFSESENRYLKKFPKLTLENIETDAYMKSIDEYLSDHIIFRKYWVQLKSLNELLLGKQENHNIYFAKDNYLIRKYRWGKIRKKFKLLKKILWEQPKCVRRNYTNRWVYFKR